MICSVKVPISDTVTLVITEMEYTPESKETSVSPYEHENIEVISGYTFPSGQDFDEIYKRNIYRVTDTLLKLYHKGEC